MKKILWFLLTVSEEEIYDDSQSQDSQLSEARSTPQPKSKWTPQSDYIEERVEQQINYNIDFASRIETNSPLLPSPPSVTVAQPLPQTSTPPLSSQSPTKRRSTSVEQPLHIDITELQNNDKSNDELQTTSAIIVDIILSPSQDSSVEPQLSANTETTDENNSKLINTLTVLKLILKSVTNYFIFDEKSIKIFNIIEILSLLFKYVLINCRKRRQISWKLIANSFTSQEDNRANSETCI